MIENMAGIYIFNDDKVLLLKRAKLDSLNEWYSIGGRFEKEELNNPENCILRELKEETGITKEDIYDLKLKYIVFRKNNNYISQNYFFFANLKNKDIKLSSCEEGILEWIKIKDIFTKKMPPSSYACLKHYFSIGKSNNNITVVASTNNNGYGEYKFTELLEFDNYLFE